MITARGAWLIGCSAVMLCLALVTTTVGTAAPANDYIIEPGKRVGPWPLGLRIEQYPLRPLPAPWKGVTGSGRHSFDGYTFEWVRGRPELSLHVCRKDKRTFAIHVIQRPDLPPETQNESRKYRTRAGLRIGDAQGRIAELHGAPLTVESEEWEFEGARYPMRAYAYPEMNVIVWVTSGRILSIAAHLRDGWERCENS
jgi:hypothetical protein